MADYCIRIGASTWSWDRTCNAHNLSVAGQSGSVSYTLNFVPNHFADVAPPQLKGNPEIEIAILVVKDMANFLF